MAIKNGGALPTSDTTNVDPNFGSLEYYQFLHFLCQRFQIKFRVDEIVSPSKCLYYRIITAVFPCLDYSTAVSIIRTLNRKHFAFISSRSQTLLVKIRSYRLFLNQIKSGNPLSLGIPCV